MHYYIFAVMTILLSASTDTNAVFAMIKSTDKFRTLSSDPRVKYEPGAETNARIIAANLNRANREVEQKQYHAYVKSVILSNERPGRLGQVHCCIKTARAYSYLSAM